LVGLFLGAHPPEHGEKLVSLVAGHLLSLLCAVVHLGDNGIINLKREAKKWVLREHRGINMKRTSSRGRRLGLG